MISKRGPCSTIQGTSFFYEKLFALKNDGIFFKKPFIRKVLSENHPLILVIIVGVNFLPAVAGPGNGSWSVVGVKFIGNVCSAF